MRRLSIRTTLTLSITAFFSIVVIVAFGSIVTLHRLDRNVENLNSTWLAGTHMLGELSDQISEFRLAETSRAIALTPAAAAEAERLADVHRERISVLTRHYVQLGGPEHSKQEIHSFTVAWLAYLEEHDAWVESDKDMKEHGPARQNSSLHEDYKAADFEIDRLINRNLSAASAQALAARHASDQATILVWSLAAAAAFLTLGIIAWVRVRITRPLGVITEALAKLAAGYRDVRVPELYRHDEIGQMAKAIETFRANAIALSDAQELAASLARHDTLTGLINRRMFIAEVETALIRVNDRLDAYAILLIDLDGFKPINDLQGRAAGDLVLCEIATRLKDLVEKERVVARLGGDEFAILVPTEPEAKAQADTCMRLASKVLTAVNAPIDVAGSRIAVGASIGIALMGADGVEPEALIRAADLAMNRAKRDGGGTYRFFERNMDAEVRNNAAFEADLRQALNEEQIKPFYQPVIELKSGRIYGFEILARWDHPTRGAIPPETFIAAAEQLALMGQLSSSLLRQACRDALVWDSEVHLAINVTPAQFQDPLLPHMILSILSSEGFRPRRFEIEVTETALVGDIDAAKIVLETLRSHGVKVTLDDFGTGYASLYHLRELKFDKVKIDRSFVQTMLENEDSGKIVHAILGLVHSLGMPVVAEGIENVVTMRLLAQLGCDYAQGFLFSKAVPAAIARQMLFDNASIAGRLNTLQQPIAV
jgi:diguanylate cyclase (GGDEF)-like protein